MKTFDLANKYIANLFTLNVKLHNLHWNIVGSDFQPVHVKLEELYDMCLDQADEVAELIRMKNLFPVASISEYTKLTTVKDLDSKEISTKDALKITLEELEALKTLALEIREKANEEDDFLTANMFEDFVTTFVKDIWFLNSMLK